MANCFVCDTCTLCCTGVIDAGEIKEYLKSQGLSATDEVVQQLLEK